MVLGQYLTQLWQVKGQIFGNSMIFQLYESISAKLSIIAARTSKLCSPMLPSPKVENSHFDLTCEVISDLSLCRSNVTPWLERSRTGLSNGVWISEISRVVSLGDNRGGRYAPPPPTECVTRQSPTGRGWIRISLCPYVSLYIRLCRVCR